MSHRVALVAALPRPTATGPERGTRELAARKSTTLTGSVRWGRRPIVHDRAHSGLTLRAGCVSRTMKSRGVVLCCHPEVAQRGSRPDECGTGVRYGEIPRHTYMVLAARNQEHSQVRGRARFRADQRSDVYKAPLSVARNASSGISSCLMRPLAGSTPMATNSSTAHTEAAVVQAIARHCCWATVLG